MTFDDLYNAYNQTVYRVVRSVLTRFLDDVPDVCQIVWLNIYTANKPFAEYTEAYIVACAKYAALARRKKVATTPEMPMTHDYAVDDISHTSTITDALGEALESLTKRQRQLLHWFYEYGFSADEIAYLCRIKKSTVYTTIKQAKRRLRAHFKRG